MTNEKKSRNFSDTVISRWILVSFSGLIISAATWASGEMFLLRFTRTGRFVPTSLRVAVAAISGLGMGFTVFFVLTFSAGLLYWLLHVVNN